MQRRASSRDHTRQAVGHGCTRVAGARTRRARQSSLVHAYRNNGTTDAQDSARRVRRRHRHRLKAPSARNHHALLTRLSCRADLMIEVACCALASTHSPLSIPDSPSQRRMRSADAGHRDPAPHCLDRSVLLMQAMQSRPSQHPRPQALPPAPSIWQLCSFACHCSACRQLALDWRHFAPRGLISPLLRPSGPRDAPCALPPLHPR